MLITTIQAVLPRQAVLSTMHSYICHLFCT